MEGSSKAQVIVNGVASPLVQVGTLLPSAAPVLVPTAGTNLSPTATSLVLHGWGFTSNDLVKLTGAYTTGNYPITGFTTSIDSLNQITLGGLSNSIEGSQRHHHQPGERLHLGPDGDLQRRRSRNHRRPATPKSSAAKSHA